ncbi:hemerythrin domain-containing protein [Mycobacterium sp. 1274761.0]|uniref:hemerythrin domain-containing protein n=1 Tax=Mycobacterium sp. 1274761.0 TaxID=1834077 RepID=UPI0007FDC1B3|nr:hemerythrin domain-containing protein [Mycobacterium sp. 1274761.0]OBK71344.1 hemerythrin [Mycobacterium sp. 1274761.0]
MTATPADIIDDIVTDHREVEEIFKELESNRNPDQRRQLVEHVITELVRHSVGEEMYLYPAARKALPDGDKLVDHELHEHAEAEEIMKKIEKTEAEDAGFDKLVGELIKDIRHHIADEEGDLLPKLREVCDRQELAELGEKFASAKKMAPTRPHPSAPDEPPANKILGPGMGLIDRLRDALSGRNS